MAKSKFAVKMKHSEDSLIALSRMQYDQFCQKNLIVRSIIAVSCILLGLSYSGSWWAILIIGYGCYLLTTKYLSANRTAHKLAAGIRESNMDFPASEFEFTDKNFVITSLNSDSTEPSTVDYSSLIRLGEDFNYFYLFPTTYGGYMIPKSGLKDSERDFRDFIQARTGLKFIRKSTPLNRFLENRRKRENEPYHL